MEIVMDKAALEQFLVERFSEVRGQFRVVAVTDAGADLALVPHPMQLRPGGTVSGPTLFALADVGAYLAILSRIGPVEMAVTTSASIDFMRKPAADADLVAECRILKLGRTLAVVDVHVVAQGASGPVARVSLTYSIPPVR